MKMNIQQLPSDYIEKIVEIALAEDVGRGDVTTDSLIPESLQGKAYMQIKENGIIAGTKVVERVFHQVDPALKVEIKIADGKPVKKNDVAMLVSGNVRSILKSERIALNFIQRMSGIATTTAKYTAKVKGMNVDIADTRKTTPVLRLFEKYSVAMGGGRNHRMDLNEAVLIKDNHFAALRALGLTYKEIIVKAKRNAPAGIVIEAETTTLQEVEDAVAVGVNIIMLDNMSLDDMKAAVKLIAGRAEVEASGGVNLRTVRAVAETGVDFISVGALTHSYKALDISLEIEPQTFKLI
jgi:nicotinate-nucleotide pyrophosphorylase (carboxylating)